MAVPTLAESPVSRLGQEEPSRELLIKHLWPDKALYASVLLFITGFVGVLAALVNGFGDLSYSSKAPGLVSSYPWGLTLVASVITALCAFMALAKKSTTWTLWGIAAGVVSFGFLGLTAMLALVALWFVYLSRIEREDVTPETRVLTADMWPDKTLAASLLLLIGSVSTIVWGIAISADLVSFRGYLLPWWAFGPLATLVGLLGLRGARELYFQRGPEFGAGCAVAIAFMVGLWVIGPVVGVGTMVLIQLARREFEFDGL